MLYRTECWRVWRILALCLIVLLSGCSSLKGAPDSPPGQTLNSLDSVYDSYVQRSFQTQDESTRVSVRNEYITIRMAIIDRNYYAYRQDLYSQRVGTDVGFDVATLGLTAAGAASSSITAKTNSSALAAALIGTKASIDKNVYFDRTLPALMSQMDGSRAEARAQLFAGMMLPSDRYTLAEADAQLTTYRDAGSLVGAVKSLTNQAAQADIKATETLRKRLPSEAEITAELKSRNFAVTSTARTPAALSLQKCVQADGSVLPEAKAPLELWFKAHHPQWAKSKGGTLPPSITPFSDFLTEPLYEPLRQEALADKSLRPVIEKCANQ